MPRIIYTGGVNPWGDGSIDPRLAIERFVEMLRARRPGITQHGINQTIKRAVGLMEPRSQGLIVAVYGRDIMAEDVTREPFWPLLGEPHRRMLLAHPLHGGAEILPGDDAGVKLAKMHATDRATVNRSVQITRAGDREMSRTYVWSRRTDWEQEMTDADWGILLEYRQAQSRFLRVESDQPWTPVRTYSHIPVRETHIARTSADVRALEREFSRSHHHLGAAVNGKG